MPLFETKEEHESFGMIGISHVQSTGTYLVGSDFRHQHFVTLSIKRAQKCRDLSRDWWLRKDAIIEVWLSEAQYVELMSRPNMGEGVPCTIKHVNGKQVPEPPLPVSRAKEARAEMKADADKCVASLEKAIAHLDAYLETGKMTKTELKEIRHELYYDALCAVKSGIPFVQQSFDAKIEQTINHAAAEIEATVTNLAMRLGVERIKELNESGPKLIDAPAVITSASAPSSVKSQACRNCKAPLGSQHRPSCSRQGMVSMESVG